MTKKEMAANDLKLFAKVFSAPLKLMVGNAFLVGTMIVGLVIYIITVERQREYGVLKAIGAPNRVLYRVVLTEALAAALLTPTVPRRRFVGKRRSVRRPSSRAAGTPTTGSSASAGPSPRAAGASRSQAEATSATRRFR